MDEFGTFTDSAQVERLHATIPFCSFCVRVCMCSQYTLHTPWAHDNSSRSVGLCGRIWDFHRLRASRAAPRQDPVSFILCVCVCAFSQYPLHTHSGEPEIERRRDQFPFHSFQVCVCVCVCVCVHSLDTLYTHPGHITVGLTRLILSLLHRDLWMNLAL